MLRAQCIRLPFSLINIPSGRPAGVSPAFNEVTPGWVLGQPFMLRRMERKVHLRSSGKLASDPFTPRTVDAMQRARAHMLDAKAAALDAKLKAAGKGSPTTSPKVARDVWA